MAVTHTILTKDGPSEKTLTPISAIRQKCLECSNWQWTEVRDCHINDCALYPYRFGKDPSREGHPGGVIKFPVANATQGMHQREKKI